MSGITYGQKVKIARAYLGMIQSQFAELLGATLSTIRNWEQDGRANPTAATKSMIDMFFAEPETAKDLLEKGRKKPKKSTLRESIFLFLFIPYATVYFYE